VKPGDVVKKGDVIAMQDDREEIAAQNAAYQDWVSAGLQVEAADADLDKKRVDLKRAQEVFADVIAQGKSNTELDEARVNVLIGVVAVKFRKGDVEQAKHKWLMAKVRSDQRRLLSPIDGLVAKVELHAGEGTDLQRPSGILIVQNDPLYVEVDMAAGRAAQLHKGQTLQVQYYGLSDEWIPAKIIHMADVADPRLNVRLRLEMPNAARPDGTRRGAGLKRGD